MRRLLIVDDEHHIVNWLVNLFQNQQNLELDILKAYTGLEALRIMENTKIDIVLLDIKMPGISGLEVSEKIMQNWQRARIIFLTGYDNFDYIYFANKHNHIDYLLKTEEDSVILSTVRNAIDSIETEIKTLELMNQTTAKDKLLQYYYQREYLKDITEGKNMQESLVNITWLDNSEKPDTEKPLILLSGKVCAVEENLFAAEHNKNILCLMQLIEQSLSLYFHFTFFEREHNTVLWFLQPAAGFHQEVKLTPVLYLKEYLDELTAYWERLTNTRIILLLYYKEIDWFYVPKTFSLMLQYTASLMPVPFDHSVAVFLEEKAERQLLPSSDQALLANKWEIHLNNLSIYLEQGEKQRFLHLLRQLVFEGKQIKSMHYLPLIGIYQNISSLLILYINHHSLSEQLATKTGLYPLYFISDFTTWEEAFSFLIRLSEYIFDLGKDKQVGKNKQTVDIIKSYINNHISEDLSLNTLSNHVNYNSSYISRLFKQTTGLSLFDYINQCRINKAKEYLIHSDLTINLIAKKTGFDTPQYFSIVFRKATGMTPKEYRSHSD